MYIHIYTQRQVKYKHRNIPVVPYLREKNTAFVVLYEI